MLAGVILECFSKPVPGASELSLRDYAFLCALDEPLEELVLGGSSSLGE